MKKQVYRLLFSNGKSYIGASVNAQNRFYGHISRVRLGIDLPVYIAWRILGTPDLIILGEYENFDEMEQKFIAEFDSVNNGYNIQTGGINAKHAESSITKMSNVKAGKILSDETRKKMSDAHVGTTGFKYSEESKRKMRASAGWKSTPVVANGIEYPSIRELLRANPNAGLKRDMIQYHIQKYGFLETEFNGVKYVILRYRP